MSEIDKLYTEYHLALKRLLVIKNERLELEAIDGNPLQIEMLKKEENRVKEQSTILGKKYQELYEPILLAQTKERELAEKKREEERDAKKTKTEAIIKSSFGNKLYLEGPVSFAEYRGGNQDRIYILGDLHGWLRPDRKPCDQLEKNPDRVLQIDEFFSILSKSNLDKIIDIHLEREHVDVKTIAAPTADEGFLFHDVVVAVDKHKSKNLIFHYNDVRRLSPILERVLRLTQFSDDLDNIFFDSEDESLHPNETLPLFEFHVRTTYNSVSKLSYIEQLVAFYSLTINLIETEKILHETQVYEKVKKLDSKNLKSILEQWESVFVKDFTERLKILQQSVQKLIEVLQIIKSMNLVTILPDKSFDIDIKLKMDQKVIDELTKFRPIVLDLLTETRSKYLKLMDTIALIQDIYLMASIFSSSQIKAVIIVGEAHARWIKSLLEEIKFQRVGNFVDVRGDIGSKFLERELPNQCLSLSSINWNPWFH